jgi:hypothetical protein
MCKHMQVSSRATSDPGRLVLHLIALDSVWRGIVRRESGVKSG